MERNQIGPAWPNALRRFPAQDLISFTQRHFITETSKLVFASRALVREDVSAGNVFTFARCQDRDDFA